MNKTGVTVRMCLKLRLEREGKTALVQYCLQRHLVTGLGTIAIVTIAPCYF